MIINEIYNFLQSSLPTTLVSEEWGTLCINFEEPLTDEQLTMFHRICNLQSATAADNARTAYKTGFKDSIVSITEIQK